MNLEQNDAAEHRRRTNGPSVKARILIALNLVAVAVAAAVGAVSIREAQRTIEQKLVFEPIRNMAALASELRLPPTQRLMQQFARIGGADMAAFDRGDGNLLASTLEPGPAEAFARRYGRDKGAADVTLSGRSYRVASAAVTPKDTYASVRPYRLVLLMPAEQVRAAQRRAVARIALAALLAILGATVLGFWMATAISRPLRNLVRRVDRIAADTPTEIGDDNQPATHSGQIDPQNRRRDATETQHERLPAEIGQLRQSFEQLEERLADAQQRLARSARLATVGQLATAIAHELRNPLSGMKMNARVLADSLAQQRDDRESVNWIIREIDRMDQVVGDLLNLRDIVGNDEKKVLSMLGPSRNVDMTALIMQTTQNLGRRCEHAGVKLTCNVAPDANRALANPDAVRQVIMNLVLNALDAVAGRENATIDVNVTAAGNDVIRATVTDNGAGLDSETDRLFEPFYTTKPHGTGLGLYIGKQIVEAYGGRIGCEYRRPGAAFWFELPKATSDG